MNKKKKIRHFVPKKKKKMEKSFIGDGAFMEATDLSQKNKCNLR